MDCYFISQNLFMKRIIAGLAIVTGFSALGFSVPPGKGDQRKLETAIFAGGCFWGVEYYFQQAKGVVSTEVGYTGGTKNNPTYKEVSYEPTGHVEAIEVTFDAAITSYEEMAKLFFEIHDPTQKNGQGPDIGAQYLSVVFYANEAQKQTAEKLI